MGKFRGRGKKGPHQLSCVDPDSRDCRPVQVDSATVSRASVPAPSLDKQHEISNSSCRQGHKNDKKGKKSFNRSPPKVNSQAVRQYFESRISVLTQEKKELALKNQELLQQLDSVHLQFEDEMEAAVEERDFLIKQNERLRADLNDLRAIKKEIMAQQDDRMEQVKASTEELAFDEDVDRTEPSTKQTSNPFSSGINGEFYVTENVNDDHDSQHWPSSLDVAETLDNKLYDMQTPDALHVFLVKNDLFLQVEPYIFFNWCLDQDITSLDDLLESCKDEEFVWHMTGNGLDATSRAEFVAVVRALEQSNNSSVDQEFAPLDRPKTSCMDNKSARTADLNAKDDNKKSKWHGKRGKAKTKLESNQQEASSKE